MNKNYLNKLSMYRQVLNVVQKNVTSWEELPAFVSKVETLESKIIDLSGLVQAQAEIMKGITADKHELRILLAKKAIVLSGALYSLAEDNHNEELKEASALRYSDLAYGAQKRVPVMVQNLLKLGNDHTVALESFGINTTDLQDLSSLNVQYLNMIDKRRSVQIKMKNHTHNVRLSVRSIDALLKNGLDRLMVKFFDSAPDFLFAYENARNLIKTPVRHTSHPAIEPDAPSHNGDLPDSFEADDGVKTSF